MNNTWWVGSQDLDEDQQDVITLNTDQSFLITGPPGSGKTNLLLLRANYISAAGKRNILILTIARTLREFLVSGSSNYQFPPEKVMTLQSWMREFLRTYGETPRNTSSGFDDQRADLVEQVGEVIAKHHISHAYEAVFIDEAQDCLPEEIEILSSISSHIFAVGDSRQQIYTDGSALGLLKERVDEVKRLRYHYRNGSRICQFADSIAKHDGSYTPLFPSCQYDEESQPSSVNVSEADSLDQQTQTIIERLRIQLQTYPGELLGVLVPKTGDLREVADTLRQSTIGSLVTTQSAADGYVALDPARPIVVSTIHGAKGLEYRSVHVAAAETLRNFALNRNLVYTAATRAKTALSFYHSAPLLGYLEQAFVNLGPPVGTPGLDAAFGGN